MKVKIITEAYIGKSDEPSLEDLINDFIKDKELIDIKYQISSVGGLLEAFHQVIIMYEDKKETADKPVVEKLKEEKADLDEKIRKLKTFLNDDEKLSNIGKDQVNLLRCQLEAMEQYSDILWARLDDLEE
ncbi:hypothetical protein FC48_GL000956 [Ligilactobacillus murinus DSM 20452 = NBRC 14221]|uniref:Uncharacterized protein n=1 Tax=Ligilactobacillus murinus DSM 20452 = NBRC 14221 TaxID=1423772 RepID=A0A0R2B6X7_9LACO|nr:hypothetical protein [Ligilactobacillus murinus]KRM73684.1 hypothetical protein FC48_GL000956 [Ligilactobacillus murinus DSM 20452 = NBRC 14221]